MYSVSTLSLLCICALHIHEILKVQTVPDGHLGEFVLGNYTGINNFSLRGVFSNRELVKRSCEGEQLENGCFLENIANYRFW